MAFLARHSSNAQWCDFIATEYLCNVLR